MTAFGARAAGKVLATLFLFASGGLLAPAAAQTPPPYDSRDENGVDRVTGRFSTTMPEGGIGDVAMVRYYGTGAGDNWSGELVRSDYGGGQYATVIFGKISERFTKSGGSWSADKGNGATLTENIADTKFTYRAPDGTTIVYMTPQSLAGPILGAGVVNVPQCPVISGGGVVLCAVPTDVARPDGGTYKLTWQTPYGCEYPQGPGGPQVPEDDSLVCNVVYRLSDVRSNSSFGMKVKYQSDIGPNAYTGVTAPGWYRRATLKFLDLSQVYCDATANNCDGVAGTWPTVSYSNPSTSVTEITNSQNGTWRIDTATSGQINIRRPGATSDTTVVNIVPSTGRTTSLTRDGETVTYNWTTSGANTTSTATTGGGETDAVTSNPTPQQPTAVVAGTSATTTYVYDAFQRVTRETRPEGDYTNYTRDLRGNITETRHVAKSGSGLADIVTTANYDTLCTISAKCNSPNWTQDALGNRTNYSYDATHGQVTRVQLPSPDADAAGTETGVRPEINYSYTALTAQVRDASNTLIPQTTTQYKVTQITACATAATCAGTANETKIAIEYNNPNLLPTKVTTSAGNGSISSAVGYAYDARDNLVSIDGPLAGTDDTTTYIYDAQDRRRGTIGPDPDGAGTRPRAASRLTFDVQSRVTKAETGTVTAATEPALNAMTVYQTVDIVYDTATGNKMKEVMSGTAGAVSVAQYSYDSDNRMLCTALRMNPATWASLPPSACTAATTSTTYGPDRISRNSYDNQGRVTKVENAVGTGDAADEVRTAYTANGLLDYVKDAESNRTTYIYDGHNRLSQTRYPSTTKGADASNASDYEGLTYDARSGVTARRLRDGTSIGYAYDDLGRLTAKDIPGGTNEDISYGYDLLGRALSAQKGTGTPLTFVHDALGRVTSQTQMLGTTSYTYDVAGRRLTMAYPGGVLTINYDYDLTGNVTKIRENGATSGVGVLASYAFDNLGRRSSVTFGNGSVQGFTYDAASRLDTLTNNLGGAATIHDLTQSFTYNPAGQIASVGRTNDAYAWQAHYNVDRAYIADGLNRIMSVGSTNFAYDTRGNLTNDGTNAFTYNAENMMTDGPGGATFKYDALGRLQASFATGQPAPTRFEYDGIDLIVEFTAPSTVKTRYVHGPGIDNPIVWYDGSAINGTTRKFLMADERGSVVSITDSAGATIHINAYDEYGIPAPGNIGRFGYTGQTWLPELGMWYYKARMYSPTLGRFMQTDPIGYADGMNWYNYVGSDPVNRTDPLGLCSFTPWVLVRWEVQEDGSLRAIKILAAWLVQDTPCQGAEGLSVINETGGNAKGHRSPAKGDRASKEFRNALSQVNKQIREECRGASNPSPQCFKLKSYNLLLHQFTSRLAELPIERIVPPSTWDMYAPPMLAGFGCGLTAMTGGGFAGVKEAAGTALGIYGCSEMFSPPE